MKARGFTRVLASALALTLLPMTLEARPDPPARLGPPPRADREWRGEDGPRHHDQGPFGRRLRMEHRRRMMRELNLTAEQREKIAGIREAQAKKAIRARADIRLAAIDLKKLIRSEHPDQAAIDREIDAVAGLRAELRKSQVQSMLQLRSVLTPAQRSKLREMRQGREG